MGWTIKELGFDSWKWQELSSSPQQPDWRWDPPILMSSGYGRLFLPCLMMRLRMC